MVMTWSRVGSLTCLSRTAARCICFKRSAESALALAALVLGTVAVAIWEVLRVGFKGRDTATHRVHFRETNRDSGPWGGKEKGGELVAVTVYRNVPVRLPVRSLVS